MFNLDRRRFLQYASASGLATTCSWFPTFADDLAKGPNRKRQCILLWMSGGASQLDTFDMKPAHANGGEFKEIDTNASGVRISEHLPQLATMADQLAIVRGMSTKEGDHGRGTYLMRTGRRPGGPVAYPTIGSSLSKELGENGSELPNFVSIAPYQQFNPGAFGPGFLGPKYAASTVGALNDYQPMPDNPDQPAGFAELGLDNLSPPTPIGDVREQRRLRTWRSLQKNFLRGRENGATLAHDTVYQKAIRMLDSTAVSAFNLTQESDSVREAYGRGRFGQGCLMARRLIERDVPFVEVNLGFDSGGIGWDTHQNNFPAVRSLSEQLDRGWATLMKELKDRDLLETTTILWMSEFGRTPTINGNAGRDHFPAAWTCVFAGGGIAGGQVHGKTSADGMTVEEGKTDVGNVLATLASAVGIDPARENVSPIGRPFKIAEGTPIQSILRS
ncbi:MAG: hypothetical protein ACI9HK_002297 [Pirellulaceae bacterium]|jgi:hypothetical protein